MWPSEQDSLIGKSLKGRLSASEHKAFHDFIVPDILVGNVISLILLGIILFYSASYYYLFFLSPLLFIDIFLGIVALLSDWNDIEKEFSLSVFVSSIFKFNCCKISERNTLTNVIRWRTFKFWNFLLLILIWIRAFGLYASVLGLNAGLIWSLADHNSCSADRFDTLSVFNPRGAFPLQRSSEKLYERYSHDDYYIFCTIDSTWANPTYDNHIIKGFETIVDGTLQINCLEPTPNGVISLENDECGGFVTTYPDNSLGLIVPYEGVTTYTTNSSTINCPGNTGGIVCFFNLLPVDCNTCNTRTCQYGNGKPLKLCPLCLNAWRRMANRPDGPDISYSHCPEYSESQSNLIDFFCQFCPGRDFGWLASETFDRDSIVVVFWLTTIYCLFLPFLETIILVFVVFSKKVKRN